jgi:hypothetical protein
MLRKLQSVLKLLSESLLTVILFHVLFGAVMILIIWEDVNILLPDDSDLLTLPWTRDWPTQNWSQRIPSSVVIAVATTCKRYPYLLKSLPFMLDQVHLLLFEGPS